MTTFDRFALRQTAIAIAVLAAAGAAHAQGSEAEATVSAGAGVVSGDSADRALFGQYNGMRTDNGYGLLDVDYSRRNAATGTSAELRGTNLGLDTRELIFLWKKQGDWRFSAHYDELVRRDPYTINTGLIGAGSTTPQVNLLTGAGIGSDLDLKIKRTGLGLSFAKWFGSAYEFEASVKTEKKEGARLFGIGITCPSPVTPGCAPTTGANVGSAVLLLPEPIDAEHTQIEARVSYAGERFRLSGGYYGSFYRNSNGTLNPAVPANLNGPLGSPLPLNTGLQSILNQPVALPPDNEANHFDLTGSYRLTPTTHANFKVAYAEATQDQSFVGAGFAAGVLPAGVRSLGGKVDTTLAQVGITSRPLPKLFLLADVRYQDRDDKTPLALYNVEGTATYTNRNLPNTRTNGKLQATYQFTGEYQGTIAANYERIDRGTFTASSAVAGITALRQETEETGFRVEVRRRMTETFSGALSLETSDRTGSNWLQPNSGLGVTEVTDPAAAFTSTAIFMPTLADRRRDKIRLFATWLPTEVLTLQFNVEGGDDRFTTAPSGQGVRKSRMDLYSVDVSYAVTDDWNVNGYASTGTQKLNQARPGGYILALGNTNTTVGLGFTGKPREQFDIGGAVSFIDDKNVYEQSLDANAYAGNAALLAATGGLPDILYRRAEVKLFGRYTMSKTSALRLDAVYQRAKFNDWAYGYNGVPFTYSDNTTVTMKQTQEVGFLGVTYIYTWR